MHFDRILRGLFPLVIGLAIGVAAYLQAVGLQYVAETTLRDRPRLPPSRIALARPAASPIRQAMADATPILERNPFDSVTGSLLVITGEGGVFPAGVVREVRPCEDARAVLIAASADGWSFAMLAGPDGKRHLRREGDPFGDQAVTAIGWDRVWLARAGVRCEARLGAALPPKASPRPKALIEERDDSGFRRLGPAEYQVERRTIDGFLENPQGAFGGVRMRPEGGRLRLDRIRPGSWPARLGLENGDRIEGINGMPLATPEQALEAYARLRTADDLRLVVVRAGQEQLLRYHVR